MIKQYEVNARSEERRFVRHLKKYRFFQTVTGSINVVTEIQKDCIVIKTNKSEKGLTIPRNKLRLAIYYVFHTRTATRKGLETYCKYTSALLGILFKIFEGRAYVKKLKHGLLRLTLKGVRFYASGLERDPFVRNLLKKSLGGHYLLLNFFHIRKDKSFLRMLEDENWYCVIDSGAYSVYNQLQKVMKVKKEAFEQNKNFQLELFEPDEIPIVALEEYAAFINEHKDNARILGFFNLDKIGCPTTTKENFRKLKHLCPGANIIPVWQFTDSLDALQKLEDEGEYDLIGIGGMIPYLSNRKQIVKEKLEKVFATFKNINFHFLGGANELLLQFPFTSTDTSAFLNSRKSDKQRQIYLQNGVRVEAPEDMTVTEIISQNLRFLTILENLYNKQQIDLFENISIA